MALLEEAAAIDGCGPIKVFYKVPSPLIFTFIAARQIITGLTAGAVKG